MLNSLISVIKCFLIFDSTLVYWNIWIQEKILLRFIDLYNILKADLFENKAKRICCGTADVQNIAVNK